MRRSNSQYPVANNCQHAVFFPPIIVLFHQDISVLGLGGSPDLGTSSYSKALSRLDTHMPSNMEFLDFSYIHILQT
jgi:hypothetical protein